MRPPIRLTMTRFTLNGSPETSACCADTPRQTGPTARIAAPDPYRSDGSEAFCVARHGSATITTGAHREHHNGRLTWASTTWTPRSTRSSTRQRTSSRRRRSTDRGGALGSGSGEGGQSQGNGPVEQQLALGGRQRRVAEQQVGDGADGERLLALKVRDRVEAGGLHLHGERAVLDQRLHGGGPVGVEDVRGQHGADVDVPVLATTTPPPRATVVRLGRGRCGPTGPDAGSLRRRCGQGERRRVAVVDAGDAAGAGRGVRVRRLRDDHVAHVEVGGHPAGGADPDDPLDAVEPVQLRCVDADGRDPQAGRQDGHRTPVEGAGVPEDAAHLGHQAGAVQDRLGDALGPPGVAGHEDVGGEVAGLGADVRCGHGGQSSPRARHSAAQARPRCRTQAAVSARSRPSALSRSPSGVMSTAVRVIPAGRPSTANRIPCSWSVIDPGRSALCTLAPASTNPVTSTSTSRPAALGTSTRSSGRPSTVVEATRLPSRTDRSSSTESTASTASAVVMAFITACSALNGASVATPVSSTTTSSRRSPSTVAVGAVTCTEPSRPAISWVRNGKPPMLTAGGCSTPGIPAAISVAIRSSVC